MNYVLILLLIVVLAISSYTDIKNGLILNKIMYPSLIITALIRLIDHPLGLIYYLLLGLLPALSLFVIAISKRNSVGGGDIKLMALIGIVLGFVGAILVFAYAMISGLIWSLISKVFCKKISNEIRMAPHFTIGTMVHLFIIGIYTAH
ncbi:A24 family peptidase [Margalitia sp. FSL K6-0131]|uniref:A24 family peptidase n=1 Tax=Margalitia sp. FSL K6-0131 TaxID=2954604 RepID=UPI0030F98F10